MTESIAINTPQIQTYLFTMFDEKSYLEKPLRWGMVGGGKGSQIGYPHRTSARRDGLFQLTCGAFDVDPIQGRNFGASLGLDPLRCYPDYLTLIKEEEGHNDGVQVVSVATPNRTHYAITKACLLAGLHVICEKPLTFHLSEAEELQKIADDKNLVLGVMYGYSGYPMIAQARAMVEKGEIGHIRIVRMQFAHGGHYRQVENHNPNAKWRVTPEESGRSYVLADVGTHCFQLGQFIAGLEIDRLSCMRQSFVSTRTPLEDNAHVMLQYKGGAVGTLWASGVNIGGTHEQRISVIGDKGSLSWWDEHPNQLEVTFAEKPKSIYESASPYLSPHAQFHRVGSGHPEGFFEAWANLYLRFGLAIAHIKDDTVPSWYPSVKEGIEGVRFVEKTVESANNHNAWVAFS